MIIPTVSQAAHLAACLVALQHAHATDPRARSRRGPQRRDARRARRGARRGWRAHRGECGQSRLCRRLPSRRAQLRTAPFVAFLNDDVRVSPGWLEPLLADHGGAAARRRGRAADARRRRTGAGDRLDHLARRHDAPARTRAPGPRSRGAGAVAWTTASACALLVRREAWDAVGGFDEDYHPAYYEDVDFCLALEAAGYEVWVDPRSDVVHAESASSAPPFKQLPVCAPSRSGWCRSVGPRRWPSACQPPDCSDRCRRPRRQRWRSSGCRVHACSSSTIGCHAMGWDPASIAWRTRVLALAAAGACVRVLPTEVDGPSSCRRSLRPALRSSKVGATTRSSASCRASDVVIVSRPNNAARVQACLRRLASARRPRLRLRRRSAVSPPSRTAGGARAGESAARCCARGGAHWLAAESAIAALCRRDRLRVRATKPRSSRRMGATTVRVHDAVVASARRRPSASLAGRADIGFVAGWLAGASSPNGDALEWFATEVLPLIVGRGAVGAAARHRHAAGPAGSIRGTARCTRRDSSTTSPSSIGTCGSRSRRCGSALA